MLSGLTNEYTKLYIQYACAVFANDKGVTYDENYHFLTYTNGRKTLEQWLFARNYKINESLYA